MAKVTANGNEKKYIVRNALEYPESVNEREMNAVDARLVPNLATVEFDKSKKEVILKCTFEDMIPLQDYFSGTVNKSMFIGFIRSLIPTLRECGKNYMNVNNILLDMNCIMVDRRTGATEFIYWPVLNSTIAVNPAVFLSDLPYRVVFDQNEDNAYIMAYIDFFQNGEPFSASSLEAVINQYDDPRDYPPQPYPDDGRRNGEYYNEEGGTVSGASGQGRDDVYSDGQYPKPKPPLKPVIYPVNPVDDFGGVPCPSCGQMNQGESSFCIFCGAPLKERQPSPAVIPDPVINRGPEPYIPPVDSESTTVLNGPQLAMFPYLIREKTQENIQIDKPSFRIGKERQYCDYFVPDNSAVSRSHADILTEGNRYFIVDNNSTNKTYINSRAIPILQKCEIFSGDKIRLGNEDFTFYIG